MSNFIDNLKVSLHKGFIDQRTSKTGNYRPKLLVNNPRNGENVLNTLLDELDSCESFIFSVAFITESGLATLKSHFLDLKRKGVKGRILTSTFLNFNQPKVFKELMKIENVEVRTTNLEGFHSKGYIFNQRNHYSLIVGSSNLTAHALKVNYEWNVKLTSHENGEIVYHFKNQFEEVWNEAHPLNEEWIESYEKRYTPLVHRKALDQVVELPSQYNINSIEEALKIKPNKMQEAALQGIQAIRDAGAKKGLVISATGTGKTYLSAFDVRRFRPKRMLFIVHREQILQKAKEDYKKVLGGIESDFGILSGTSKQTNAKYLFATIQSISKEETLAQFDSKEFDYILIDEVHKAGAQSYQKVIDYFNPDFLMGMTATPERTDDYNIFELFDYNIAYEIRLQEALEEDMLCPFHYFGVTDLEYNGELIDETAVLSKLVTEERVNHILEKIHYYGFSGEKVKGLMFCSRKEEAKKLANAFNEKGLRTVALVGDHSQEERDRRVKQLEEGLLDYIITVDIFNEGIDIPSVNQVVMLRQTQSSIIFIQQLGRGLRKHPTKEFVTIIDFIGNYKNNYLIPIALSGDKSHNKDKLRRCIKDTSYIKGVSTINFEEIAKKQIFKAINNSNLTALKVLKEAFVELKNRIGRIPYLYDFVVNHSIDPEVIITKHTNYYQFLLKLKEEVPLLSKYENSVLTMLSMEILNGKRKHEIILMDLLLQQETVKFDDYIKHLIDSNCLVDDKTLSSVLRVFSLEFFTQSYKEKYGNQPIILNVDGTFKFNDVVCRSLNDNPFFKFLVKDVIKSAREKSMHYKTEVPLTLYQKYSRKDVCKLLNWSNDESSTLYGYKTKHGTCPIFVTYHKKEDVESSINYADEFLSPEVLKWATRSNRTLESQEVKTIIESEEKGIELHIFVKKDDDEGTDFYYLGKATPDKNYIEQVTMEDGKGKKLPVVHMNLVMENPIENKLYNYIINGTN
ncbi:DEAD/DEAH box helicase [Neobacillus sedimentimangrovi]|uniref:DEAD/DEAH box helicase n=1 Tax=Neobacillus sedimentimangrovi TaxID=2699460 RepID=A0ABS8QEI3_9BACI|nr:DEAD/DEAH box helicase [Neobacillus sedimentimangrovi]MCD4837558.1 DEAD/DEAH box helicase [Neobacillus sedimentimangrovi]